MNKQKTPSGALQVDWWDLVKVAGTLTLVGLMESIAIAKALAAQHKHPLDANQELIGERKQWR